MPDDAPPPARISHDVAKLAWPKVAPQFAWDRAAPRVLRNNDRLPAEAQEAFKHIWDGIVVEVGQYFDTHSYREARKPKNLKALLARMRGLLNQAQELAIVCGTYWPLPTSPTTQAVVATGGTAAVTGAEQLVGIGSVGMAATGVVASALIIEIYETYVAASARTKQYRAAQRDPDHVRIAVDLADAWSHRRTEEIAMRQFVDAALERLEMRLAIRSWRRVLEAVSLVVGVVWAAGSTSLAMRKVLKLPMRPADEEELKRMAEKLRPEGQPAYDERIQALAEILAKDDDDPAV
jgi:hypothetical protein